jgi:CrcB protein
MSAPLWLAVGVLGGLGAIARFLTDRAVSQRLRSAFPFGTFVVNISGAFALGLLAGVGPGRGAYVVVGGGLLGAYTTFSTWMLETEDRGRGGHRTVAAANVLGSLAVGLAAVWLGRRVGLAL